MSTITTRAGKGSPLTNNEVDANFTNLNTDKAELSGATFTGEITANGGIALGDNDKATFGASDDLQIYHDGGNSWIRDVGTGVLDISTNGTGIQLTKNGAEGMINALVDGAVTLYYDSSSKLATTSTGIDVTGNVSLPDNGKAIFGAGSDLQIYHDGSGSYIDDAGTGNLFVRADSLQLRRADGSQLYLAANTGAEVALYHAGNAKLSTTSTGIDVTGDVNTSGLLKVGVNDTEYANNYLRFKPTGAAYIDHNTVGQAINFRLSNASSLDKTVMTLSSAGNLLVGKTATSFSEAGVVLRGDSAEGLIQATRANNECIEVNRTGTDGAIATFAKSGTTVGSIGVNTSGLYIADAGVGFRFDSGGTDDIIPCNATGGAADASINLGSSGARFNDLYLSGGALTSTVKFLTNTTVSGSDATIFRPADNTMAFSTNGAERMRISSAGHTTFGTTNLTPADSAVNGTSILSDGRINHNAQSQPAAVIGRTGTDGAIVDLRKNGAPVGSIGSVSGVVTYIVLDPRTNGVGLRGGENKLIPTQNTGSDTNGFMDIGSSTTRFKDLYLSGNVNSSQLLMKDGATTVGGLFQEYAITGSGTAKDPTLFAETGNGINFMVNGSATKAVRLDTSGNVGIGTSSATSIPGFAKVVKLEDSSSASYVVSGGVHEADFAISSTGGYLGTVTNAPMRFVTNSTERMRIDSSGNLLVGTTNNAGTNAEGFILYDGSGSSRLYIGHVNGTANGTQFAVFNYNTGKIGDITQNGVSAVLYNTTSDQRLKENIADADDAGSKIDAIQVRQYDWKADGSHQDYGMIAQELQTVAPEAVSVPEDSEEMMGVDYSKLVPMLVKEIQSLRNRVAQLEE